MEKVCEKVYFSTKKQAQRRADSINNNNSQKHLYVYKCPNCTGFHLTKNVQRQSDEQKSISELLDRISILKEEIHNQNLANHRNNLKAKIKDDLLNDFLIRYGLADIFNAIVEVSLEYNDV